MPATWHSSYRNPCCILSSRQLGSTSDQSTGFCSCSKALNPNCLFPLLCKSLKRSVATEKDSNRAHLERFAVPNLCGRLKAIWIHQTAAHPFRNSRVGLLARTECLRHRGAGQAAKTSLAGSEVW